MGGWARKQRAGARSWWPGEIWWPRSLCYKGQEGEEAEDHSVQEYLALRELLKPGEEWEPPGEGCVRVRGGGETFKHRRNEG